MRSKHLQHWILLPGVLFLIWTSSVLAGPGSCGKGYITSLYGGGWNQDGLILTLEPLNGSKPPNFYYNNTLRFAPNLSEARLDRIQSAALLALANGNVVEFYSHNVNALYQPNCSSLTQIQVFRKSPIDQ